MAFDVFKLSDSGTGVNASYENFAHAEKIYLNSRKGQDLFAFKRDAQMIFQDPMTFLNPVLKIETQLVEPILNHKADFVKASFERTGGRVTELVAKPLLELTYPRLSKFEQPLSGIIAVKTKLIKQIKFGIN